MNATQELFQLADTAAGILARLHEQAIREPLRVLRQVCDEVCGGSGFLDSGIS
jgi:hypothetical protein